MTNSMLALNPADLQTVAIATEAFIYGLPLVLMDITKEQNTNYIKASGKGAPINQFSNKSKFPDYTNTKVVRPNCDTYYSTAFLDLTDEPLVMTVPPTGDTYYMLPFLDAFTNCIKNSPGTRTGETEGGNYLILGPNQTSTTNSDIPNLVNTISSSTNLVWILGRFQVNDPATDGQTVLALQEELKLTPLSQWGKDYNAAHGNKQVMDERDPNTIVENMPIENFFTRLNQLLQSNPPADYDANAMQKYAQIGVGTEATTPFNEMNFATEVMEAMQNIPSKTLVKLEQFSNAGDSAWKGLIGDFVADYKDQYFKRAMVAYVGLGANLCKDAVYYKTTSPDLNGSNNYQMRFTEVPPNKAFWSLTLYNEAGYFIDAPVNGLGHSDSAPLHPESNGDYIIFIQSEPPADSTYANNWLPSPAGDPFNLMIRVYWPQDEVLDNNYVPPAIEQQ